ncbi:glycosytransferase [Bradyrhizobium sp. USDA 10063]
MLKRIGVQEIFLPKKVSAGPTFRSASVDWSEDERLTIPKEDLAILNAADWYDEPGVDAWRIANEHFQLIFFIVLNAHFFRSVMRNFYGAKIWRTYGLSDPPQSYARLLSLFGWRRGSTWSAHAAGSLWFGQAYDHLADVEPRWLAERAVNLPVGLQDTDIRDDWTGSDRRIFFVCPDLAFNEYYQDIYRDFKRTFAGLPYVVAGAQPLRVQDDDHVLGYVSGEQHRRNMRSFAVMYYHSSERYHVHYHPFEAVRAGMPLVFMGGGLLDRLGGLRLPGRCKTAEEAKSKIERILAGDKRLIGQIRESQTVLLDSMKVEHCEPSWRTGIELILKRTEDERSTAPIIRKKRVAVLLPVAYRGGSLRGAKLLANAVALGSQQFGSPVDVVFGHLDDPESYPDREFEDLHGDIERRAFHWRTLPPGEALRACAYAGMDQPLSGTYAVPDDGINQFFDCDLWIFVSDRLRFPVLPVRPYVLMVYDYLQRYVPIMDEKASQRVIDRAHAAEAVLVTTDFTANDARQFAGLPARKVKKVPLLVPTFSAAGGSARGGPPASEYFVWTTNLALHKNHRNALEALRIYYEEYDGRFECHVTGVDTDKLFTGKLRHLVAAREIHSASRALKASLKTEGDLPDSIYRRKLRDAAFLWHPGLIDNGTFSVVEAASVGVPALSSDYPAMREIDRQFELGLTWSDPNDPTDMAGKLKQMETAQRNTPRPEVLARHSLDRSAGAYWQVIEEFL